MASKASEAEKKEEQAKSIQMFKIRKLIASLQRARG